jgi:predicted  nucleic acid-binding Zn-ribbon protein
MVHASLYAAGDTTTNHGVVFQAELKRLSTEGAFVGIVATPEERDSLHAWLTSESARLDADSEEVRRESEELERERKDLEQEMADMNARVSAAAAEGVRFPDQRGLDALNARRDSYNHKVEEANARAERGREAVAEFNRQGERYKLMQSYPDGLDEDGLVAPRAALRSK